MGLYGEPFAHSGDVSIRRMRDDRQDYVLLSNWLTDEKVLEFVFGRDNPHDLDMVREKYGPRTRGEHPTVPCIIQYRSRPVGYIQYTPLSKDEGLEFGFVDIDGTYGLDLWIGDVSLWNQGIGTAAVSSVTQYVFEEVGVLRTTIDPRTTNGRAIRCYEKCGFEKIKVLPGHELFEGERRDGWLMVLARPLTA